MYVHLVLYRYCRISDRTGSNAIFMKNSYRYINTVLQKNIEKIPRYMDGIQVLYMFLDRVLVLVTMLIKTPRWTAVMNF